MIIKNFLAIGTSDLRKKALNIINAGLEAIKTEKIIRENIKLKNNHLTIKNKLFNLNNYKRIFVIGFGKASALMGKELERILKNKISDGIIISTKKIKLKKIKTFKGTHPMPYLSNVNTTKKIVKLIKKLNKEDLVICLISGGGSSLLCYPTISFKKYLKIIKKAFTSGADIKKFNKIRKKYSNVKGGKLAKLTKARIISLIFSDVVGDDLSTIASGPTVGKNLKHVKNILLLNNNVALEAMRKKAISLGLNPLIYSNKVKGEAKLVGKKILKRFKKLNKNCLLFAGETTVTVKGFGLGGRNQELCLGAIEEISKLKNTVLISVGTDGIDGPTNAAGAIVDNKSLKKSINEKLNYKKYLKNNDSYHFFKKMNDLVFTGITGINVADIGIILKI